jgi:hypothetical protein
VPSRMSLAVERNAGDDDLRARCEGVAESNRCVLMQQFAATGGEGRGPDDHGQGEVGDTARPMGDVDLFARELMRETG